MKDIRSGGGYSCWLSFKFLLLIFAVDGAHDPGNPLSMFMSVCITECTMTVHACVNK